MSKLSPELVEYFGYSIGKRYLLKRAWVLNLITFIANPTYEDEYVKIDNKMFYVKQDEELILITKNYTKPVIGLKDTLIVNKDFISNCNGNTETTFGRVFMNYVINVHCLNNKVSFINEVFTLGDIEDDYIEPNLVDVDNEDSNTKITTEDYYKFLDIRAYIDSLSAFVTIGASEYNIVKAPGTEEFKAKVIAELIEKNGPKALEDPLVVNELEDRLVAFDTEYIKQDPSYGKLITKKVTNMARKRMYLIYGIGNDLSGEAKPVISSLSGGLNKDIGEIHSLFNDAIGGSAMRGNETKSMGVITKYLIRATADILIMNTDCGSKIFYEETITKHHVGKNILVSDKLFNLTSNNIDTYIGKKFPMRDVRFCKLDNHVCTTCMGSQYEEYPNATPLMATENGGKFLKESLKKFHGTVLKTTTIDLNDLI